MKTMQQMFLSGLLMACLSGCATHELMNQGQRTHNVTKTEKHTLVNDRVLAFAKPVMPIANVPANSIVIVGEQNSYVLTAGADEFVTLIGRLDAKYIRLTKSLDFYSEKNDGQFSGELAFKYRKLTEDVSKEERQFLLQNNVTDCTSYEDKNLKASGFCFSIPLKGVVFPAVNNASGLKKFSKPYPMTIYTTTSTTSVEHHQSGTGKSVAKKLILLPFAVAFDVVTLPFQAIGEIFDD